MKFACSLSVFSDFHLSRSFSKQMPIFHSRLNTRAGCWALERGKEKEPYHTKTIPHVHLDQILGPYHTGGRHIESRAAIGPGKGLDTPLPAVAVAGFRGGEADCSPQLRGEGGWNSSPPGVGPHDPPSPGLHQQATSIRFFLTKARKLPGSYEVALCRYHPCGWRPLAS